MDLFLDNAPLEFEKVAMEAKLSEDMNAWPQQILDHLYRQAPFTSDYAPKIVLDDKDEDRRYAMGKVILINKLAINPRDDATPKEMRGSQKVIIPIIVRDGKLAPMDLLLHNGAVEPLTEERLRRALFRPNLFDAIRERPGDISMVEQLYPPGRQSGGGRGMMSADGAGGMERTASPEFLMDAILPTIKKAHINEVTAQLNADPSLRSALMHNEAAVPFLSKLAALEDAPESGDYLQKVAESIVPNVLQLSKVQGGFKLKTANTEALLPDEASVDRPTAVGALGGDLVSRVETDGTTTITSCCAAKDTLEDIEISVVTSFGIYKVRTKGENKELIGWVFPKVMAFSGEVLPMAVFSNGSQAGMQENIAGVAVARQTDVLDEPPSGQGCFYRATKAGAVAFVPVKINSEVETPDGKSYICETTLGERVTLVKLPNLTAVAPIAEGRYGIPDDCGFMPLENVVPLASSPDDFTKTAEARAVAGQAVRVISDGSSYSFEGQPIDKLAGVMDSQFLSLDGAVFLATCLGQEPEKAKVAFSTMRKKAAPEVWFTAYPVTTFKEKYAAAREVAAKFLSALPDLRVNLVKEAAPIEDPMAVDKILSLNFLNPENLSVFVAYVPQIEEVVKKLSEVLLASRLGLSGVDKNALQKALVHLDKITDGLRSLGEMPQA